MSDNQVRYKPTAYQQKMNDIQSGTNFDIPEEGISILGLLIVGLLIWGLVEFYVPILHFLQDNDYIDTPQSYSMNNSIDFNLTTMGQKYV